MDSNPFKLVGLARELRVTEKVLMTGTISMSYSAISDVRAPLET